MVLAALLVTIAATCTLAATRAWTGSAPDRLERFRELAASRLALGDLAEPDNPAEAYRDIYALLDDEIVDSLASGGVFASPEFLQDRLDAFGEAWGGAQIRLTRLGRLFVGAFRLTEAGGGNSVRVYGPLRDGAALLATLYREGRPCVLVRSVCATSCAIRVGRRAATARPSRRTCTGWRRRRVL